MLSKQRRHAWSQLRVIIRIAVVHSTGRTDDRTAMSDAPTSRRTASLVLRSSKCIEMPQSGHCDTSSRHRDPTLDPRCRGRSRSSQYDRQTSREGESASQLSSTVIFSNSRAAMDRATELAGKVDLTAAWSFAQSL